MSYAFEVNVLTLILVSCTVLKAVSMCTDDQYQSIGLDGHQTCRPCSKCPAGYSMHVPCNKYSDTKCKILTGQKSKCRNWKYDSQDKIITFITKRASNNTAQAKQCQHDQFYSTRMAVCVKCTRCGKGYYVKTPCLVTKDAICRPCQRGYYSVNENQLTCQKCQDCKAGSYINRTCTSIRNTVCKPCPDKFFTTDSNFLYFCTPCSRCSEGQEILQRCSKTENTKCGACHSGYFKVQSSSECAKCSECKEDSDNSSTIVEECRKTSVDQRQICAPEIVKQHERLLRVGALKALSTTSGSNHLSLNEFPISISSSTDQSPLRTPTVIAISICAIAFTAILLLFTAFVHSVRKNKRTFQAIPLQLITESSGDTETIQPPTESVDYRNSWENRIFVQEDSPVIYHYNSVPQNIHKTADPHAPGRRKSLYDSDPLDKIYTSDNYTYSSDANLTGIFSVSEAGV